MPQVEGNQIMNTPFSYRNSARLDVTSRDDQAMAEIRQRVVGLDVKVPLLDGSKQPYVNLDNAATTPALWDVLETLDLFMPWYSSIHRGKGFKSEISSEAYDDAREIVGRFFGADMSSQVVIFVKNTTEAVNKAARRIGLNKDDVVLLSLMEHHSNDLPWRAQATVVHLALRPDGSLDMDDVRAKFEQYGDRVKLLAVSGASNVTGYINPLHELAELAHSYGALILADAAQLAPHRGIHIRPASDPGHLDFLVASAHKMYAPFGTGVLIGPRQDLLGGRAGHQRRRHRGNRHRGCGVLGRAARPRGSRQPQRGRCGGDGRGVQGADRDRHGAVGGARSRSDALRLDRNAQDRRHRDIWRR